MHIMVLDPQAPISAIADLGGAYHQSGGLDVTYNEALWLARIRVKDAIKAAGLKVSQISSRQITVAAMVLVATGLIFPSITADACALRRRA